MAYQLRQVSLPLLPSGASDIRILHFSDLHLTPARKGEIADIKGWGIAPVLRPAILQVLLFLIKGQPIGFRLSSKK